MNVKIFYKFIANKQQFDDAKYYDEVNLICAGCSNTFTRKKIRTIASFRRRNSPELYCSCICAAKNNTKVKRGQIFTCPQCKKEFYQPYNQTKIQKVKFCSHKCSTIYSNLRREKKIKYCECGNTTSLHRKYCDECYQQKLLPNKTIADVVKRCNSNRYDIIRAHARGLFSGQKLICQNCGYDKHVEVCHIKPISEFSKTALIKEINDLKNLVYLCRNCHWEFDNSLLELGGAGGN